LKSVTAASAVVVRQARLEDGPALQRIDVATHSDDASPGSAPQPGDEFFSERTRPEHILVAEVDGAPAGYIKVRAMYPEFTSADHVLYVAGLAVAPQSQGRGVGQRLVMAAVHDARSRGARRLILNVLGTNEVARRLYERCGFVVEGVHAEQFYLGGRYVDDVLLAFDLTRQPPGLAVQT
jgi:ribosomal protein S18 acetylase RimI-like enzyme